MLRPFLADLHVHTVLSGCAEVEMIPPLILRQAKRLGLSLIAITDHNSCHNAEAVIQASVGTDIHVLPGMELQSKPRESGSVARGRIHTKPARGRVRHEE